MLFCIDDRGRIRFGELGDALLHRGCVRRIPSPKVWTGQRSDRIRETLSWVGTGPGGDLVGPDRCPGADLDATRSYGVRRIPEPHEGPGPCREEPGGSGDMVWALGIWWSGRASDIGRG